MGCRVGRIKMTRALQLEIGKTGFFGANSRIHLINTAHRSSKPVRNTSSEIHGRIEGQAIRSSGRNVPTLPDLIAAFPELCRHRGISEPVGHQSFSPLRRWQAPVAAAT